MWYVRLTNDVDERAYNHSNNKPYKTARSAVKRGNVLIERVIRHHDLAWPKVNIFNPTTMESYTFDKETIQRELAFYGEK